MIRTHAVDFFPRTRWDTRDTERVCARGGVSEPFLRAVPTAIHSSAILPRSLTWDISPAAMGK